MASSLAAVQCLSPFAFSESSSSYIAFPCTVSASFSSHGFNHNNSQSNNLAWRNPSFISFRTPKLICRAAEYKFPDPIPEFAEAETEKFRTHLLDKLSKKDIFGDSLEEVVGLCTEILGNFLHTEYGGPGTLLVIPFTEMAYALEERGLPGSPQAARAAVKWAQKHVDNDWDEWTSKNS